ncbi:MAG: hypothetical protein AVDCRST_MAG34-2573, partial [uncultured Nocardioidaceae bacterium]
GRPTRRPPRGHRPDGGGGADLHPHDRRQRERRAARTRGDRPAPGCVRRRRTGAAARGL